MRMDAGLQIDRWLPQRAWQAIRVGAVLLARMTHDGLRFQPPLDTTCHGMNDHRYRPYEAGIGTAHLEASRAIVRAFKPAQARVVLGSPGCVEKGGPFK